MTPPGYGKLGARFPVVYWLHADDPEPQARVHRLAAYVAAHQVMVVDGGPVGSKDTFAMYFPELVEQVDGTMRTIADRAHRGVAGIGGAGFTAMFLAGKYPGLVGSASSLDGTTEAEVGPQGMTVDYRLDDMADNFEGQRTRFSQSTADPLAFYHRRLNAIWAYTRPSYQNFTFLAGEDLAEIDRMLEFHRSAFAFPLPAPLAFSHADAWPNFSTWGWEVLSNRRQPGFTVLKNVSKTGFRSSVREYLPGGGIIPGVKLSIGSPPIYPPNALLNVTYIHLVDGNVRRTQQRADAHGRLSFELDGDAWEVGISSGPLLSISGYTIEGANWATAGKAVNLKVRFWNKGGAPMPTTPIHWESLDDGVKFTNVQDRLYTLVPGQSGTLPVTFTVNDPERAAAAICAVAGAYRLWIEVPLFPSAEPAKDFQIADGRTLPVYQHAIKKTELRFGEGNGDGHAAPGETFAILIPDGDALRAAELFTNDACVENVTRGSDSWDEYDHAGASVNYSLPSIRPDCEPGHVVHMLARILVPDGANTHLKYLTLEFPVWYKNENR